MTVHELHPEQARPDVLGPVNVEAEQAVLGALLIRNDTIGVLSSMLRPEHFSEDIHRRIYGVALELFAQDKPVTLGTLKTKFRRHSRNFRGLVGLFTHRKTLGERRSLVSGDESRGG